MVAISLVEVISFFLSSKIMDHPKVGRKKGVYYGLFIVLFFSLMIIMVGEDNIMLLFAAFAIIKFIISMVFMVTPLLFRLFIPTLHKSTKRWFEAKLWAYAQFLGGLARCCWGWWGFTQWSGSEATGCTFSLLHWVEFQAMGHILCPIVQVIVQYRDSFFAIL